MQGQIVDSLLYFLPQRVILRSESQVILGLAWSVAQFPKISSPKTILVLGTSVAGLESGLVC